MPGTPNGSPTAEKVRRERRRPRGSGCVRERARGGWEAVIRWTDPDGRRRSKSEIHRSRREAIDALGDLSRKYAPGSINRSTDIPFKEFAEDWLEVKKRDWAFATYRTQKVYVEKHILGPGSSLRSLQLRSITFEHIDWFMAEMQRAEIGASTRNSVFVTLGMVFNHAVRKQRVTANPVENATSPKVVKATGRFALTIPQARALLVAADHHPMGSLIRFMLDAGCRPSEAYALSWDDVNPAEGFVVIRHSLTKDHSNHFTRKSTKNEETRKVFVSSETMAAMVAAPRHPSAKWNLVWTTDQGEPLDKDTFRKTVAYAIFKEAGIAAGSKGGGFVVHGLRHTSASLAFQVRLDVPTVKERGGWKNDRILLDIYAHSSDDAQREGVARLAASMKSDTPKAFESVFGSHGILAANARRR